ncbi:hypothetical protein [Paenibacillus flagellatus]|uniref:Uncharacterized protein n=1 Tax=Paenibacillus flagellatus TaxID=2211139 RepID=A0A2V5KP78_9BACL|nr:hypothetical protein [Paenibacillus flagellatus]PYI57230.1 hypothetical protein DLM86_01955 [Paenibacillus flagellatus]
MGKGRVWAAATAALLAIATASPVASAASYELSATAKAAFDKMAANAGGTLQQKLTAQYGELLSLQRQERSLEEAVKTLQKSNDEALSDVRARIKQIDAAKLEKLKQEADRTKERYKPLLEQYTALNKRLEAARAMKSKELSALLRLQADAMKPAVQLAKLDIQAKDNALQTAKRSVSDKQKAIRGTLAGIEPLEAKIRAERDAESAQKKQAAADWKSFPPHVKQADARAAANTLEALVARYRQMVDRKEAIRGLETQISSVIAKAKEQIPG